MGKSKNPPAMLLDVSDFLDDYDVLYVFTPEENWGYFKMCCELWRNKGEIPENFDKFWKIFGKKTKKSAEKIWSVIARKFVIQDGKISHKRVTLEMQRFIDKQLKMSEGGKKGMSSRWNLPVPANNPLITINSIQSNNCIDKSIKEVAELDCLIVEQRNLFVEQIEKLLRPRGKEVETFAKLTRWMVHIVQTGEADVNIFKRGVEIAKVAKVEGKRPKAYFVHLMKQETGFKKG